MSDQTDTPRKTPGADDNFATNLRQRREMLGLTQEAVAERMQKKGHPFHQATIYKIESGARRVQLTEAIDLSQIVGLSVSQMAKDPAKQLLAWRVEQASRVMHDTYIEMVELFKNYTGRQTALKWALEDYEKEGVDSLGDLVDEYREEVSRPASLTMALIEVRYHMLDSGPESMEFEGELNRIDLTPEQQALMVTWEVEKAKLALEIAQDRLDTACSIKEKLDTASKATGE